MDLSGVSGRGVILIVMHGCSRMAVEPRIPTVPGRSTSEFCRPEIYCLHQARSDMTCWASSMKGELHPTYTCRRFFSPSCNGRNSNQPLGHAAAGSPLLSPLRVRA